MEKRNLIWVSIAACSVFLMDLFDSRLINAQDSACSDLWRKSVAIAEKNRRWVPGKILEKEIVVIEGGEILQKTERHLRFFLTKDFELDAELIRTKLNDTDITEKEKEAFKNKLKQNQYVTSKAFEMPFSRHLQSTLSGIHVVKTTVLENLECVEFHYRQTVEKIKWQGVAWIEKNSGIPLKIEFKTKNLIEENNTTITRFSGAITYRHDDPNQWYPKHVRYNMDVTTKVFPFYTFKGAVENDIRLNDYFRR